MIPLTAVIMAVSDSRKTVQELFTEAGGNNRIKNEYNIAKFRGFSAIMDTE